MLAPDSTGVNGGTPWALFTVPGPGVTNSVDLIIDPVAGSASWGRKLLLVGEPGGGVPVFEGSAADGGERVAGVRSHAPDGWLCHVYMSSLTDEMCAALALGGLEMCRVFGGLSSFSDSMFLGANTLFEAHGVDHVSSALFDGVDPLVSFLCMVAMGNFSFLSPELVLGLVSARYEAVLNGQAPLSVFSEAGLAAALVSPVTGKDDSWHARFNVPETQPFNDATWWYSYRAAASYVTACGLVAPEPDWVRFDPTVALCPDSCLEGVADRTVTLFDGLGTGSRDGGALTVDRFEFFVPAAGFFPHPIDITGLAGERVAELEEMMVAISADRCFELDTLSRGDLSMVAATTGDLSIPPLLIGHYLAFVPLPVGFFDRLGEALRPVRDGSPLRAGSQPWEEALPGVAASLSGRTVGSPFGGDSVPLGFLAGPGVMSRLPVDECASFSIDFDAGLGCAGLAELETVEVSDLVKSRYLDTVASLLAEYPEESETVGGGLSLRWYLEVSGIPTSS